MYGRILLTHARSRLLLLAYFLSVLFRLLLLPFLLSVPRSCLLLRSRYCECFQASIYCGENCRCDGCKNHEGSKERTILEAKGQVKPVRKMDAATVAAAAAAAASAAASGTIRDGSHQTQPGLLPLGPHYQALMSHHSSGGSLSVGIAAASSLMLPSSNLPPPTASLSGVFMPTNSQNRTAMQLQQLQQIQQQQQQQQQQSPATVSTKQMIENTVKAYGKMTERIHTHTDDDRLVRLGLPPCVFLSPSSVVVVCLLSLFHSFPASPSLLSPLLFLLFLEWSSHLRLASSLDASTDRDGREGVWQGCHRDDEWDSSRGRG